MLTLIPDKKKLPEDEGLCYRVPYTYLHGNLEKDNEWDIFYLRDDQNIFDNGKNLEAGVYPSVCELEYCMFYLWKTSEGFHGLACYTTDKKANDYALQCFHLKSNTI